MANSWYISQTVWIALAQWASGTYTAGEIIRPLTVGASGNQCAYICTTGGTSGGSEPSWNTNDNGTTTDGAVVWTNVTGHSKLSPAGSIATITSGDLISRRTGAGDSLYFDHTHAETNCDVNGLNNFGFGNIVQAPMAFSVNFGGSTPPVAADYTPGASISFASGARCDLNGSFAFYGINFSFTNAAYCFSTQENNYLRFVDSVIANNGGGQGFNFQTGASLELHNVTFNVTSSVSYLFAGMQTGSIRWSNNGTVAAFTGGQYPTYILLPSNNCSASVLFENLNLGSFAGTAIIYPVNGPYWPIQFNSCVLPDSVPILSNPSVNGPAFQLEMYNCAPSGSAANYDNSFMSSFGSITTDITNYYSGGATDGYQPFSHHMVPSANMGPIGSGLTLNSFDIVSYCSNPGTALTATVHCVCDTGALTNADVFLEIDYPGSNTSSIGAKTTSNTPLSNAALTAGTIGSWSSPPTGGSAYDLSVTFTPEARGLARGRVKVALPSINLWVDPVLHGVS